MYKQYIVIRNDLPMSAGKLAAQVSHASIAFITNSIQVEEKPDHYIGSMIIEKGLWDNWLNPKSSFTKVCLGIHNKNKAYQLIEKAKEFGLVEGKDFFPIRDEARTELQDYREEDGRVLTCIGFKPMEETELKELLGKLHLYQKTFA